MLALNNENNRDKHYQYNLIIENFCRDKYVHHSKPNLAKWNSVTVRFEKTMQSSWII